MNKSSHRDSNLTMINDESTTRESRWIETDNDTDHLYHSDYPTDYLDIDVRVSLILAQPYYIIALILGGAAILANVTSLAAIYQIRRSMTSHFRILISLIASDLLVDFSLIAHIINTVIHPLLQPGYGSWNYRLNTRCSFMSIKAFNTTGLNITLLNLMALAIDHYVAILRPFQLHQLMSKRRTILMIVIIWGIAVVSGFSDFFSPISHTLSNSSTNATISYNICEIVWLSAYQEEYITFAIVVVCFASMLYMYLHIYCEVKGKHFSDTENNIKAHRNKRALVTTLLILGTFILCWLPICVFNIVMIIIIKGGISPKTVARMVPVLAKADKYLYDLMLLNTLCDPVIYAIRINEVRRGYFALVNKCNLRKSLSRKSSACLQTESVASTLLGDEIRRNSQKQKGVSDNNRITVM